MNKTLKKVILGVVIAAAVVAAVWGILTVLRTARRKPVNVYPVESFMTTNEWGSSSQSYGTVTTDKLQKVYLTDSQTVSQVYVTEGQTVKKGDKLLSYDTTLTSLDLERAKISLEERELTLNGMKDRLQAMDNLKYKDYWQAERDKLAKELAEAEAQARDGAGVSQNAPVPNVDLLAGTMDGTEDHPFFMKEEDFTPAVLAGLRTSLGTVSASDDLHVVIYKNNDETGDSIVCGVILHGDGDVMSFYDPAVIIPTGEDAASANDRVTYLRGRVNLLDNLMSLVDMPKTEKDALVQKGQLQQQINQATVELKIAQMEFQRKSSEVADASVYCQQDGVVKAVRDPKEAYANNEAVVEVSAGGGYYVTGAISELELGNVQIGDTVQINSWMSGVSCEGTIVSVEDYPTTQSGWSDGNQNVSYYPFKAFVSEDANLQPNEGVQVSYRSDSNTNAWYLESMFIRVDNGKSYVYVRGENGLLEKRDVVTGADLWGSYTEIRSGLTRDDLVAFPYGQDVVEGAKTQEATPDQLYNY